MNYHVLSQLGGYIDTLLNEEKTTVFSDTRVTFNIKKYRITTICSIDKIKFKCLKLSRLSEFWLQSFKKMMKEQKKVALVWLVELLIIFFLKVTLSDILPNSDHCSDCTAVARSNVIFRVLNSFSSHFKLHGLYNLIRRAHYVYRTL